MTCAIPTGQSKGTDNIVAAVTTNVKKGWCLIVRELVTMLDLTYTTVQSTLTLDLALEKSLPAGYPNCCPLPKKECSEDFLQLLRQWSLAVLDKIVTMEESGMSFHTPEMKLESKQWVQKGQPGPFRAQVHASRMKQIFIIYFEGRSKWFPYSEMPGAFPIQTTSPRAKSSTPCTSKVHCQDF